MHKFDDGKYLVGTTGSENIYGGDGNDVIKGLAGADVLVGEGGDDSLYGGNGADYLIGGDGNDVLFGGKGADWADYEKAASAVTIDLNITTAQDTHGAGVDTLFSIEKLYGSAFDDTLTGDKGDNLLHGADGADTLSGGGGRDSLIGGDGNDSLVGGHDADYFEGGRGDDTFVLHNKSDMVVELKDEGIDTVETSRNHHLEANVENLTLLGSGDVNAFGNHLANLITGNRGDNVIEFGKGDTVSGGGGEDTYLLESHFRGDATVDAGGFASKVDFSQIDADVTVDGDQAFHASPDGEHFSGVAGEIIARQLPGSDPEGTLYIAFDTDGDGKADGSLILQHWDHVTFVL